MGGYAEALIERVRRARAAVREARRDGDAYAVAVAEDELDDALRLARRHGLALTEDDGDAEDAENGTDAGDDADGRGAGRAEA
ncbi:hypothetical protein [Streptomyces sp. G45]|uniref:hypothetical protein n=1 Tax=Streptomyces sp. G45 TaxID=3406627 RepID=UPI003C20D508